MSEKLIENTINERLTGDSQKNALSFVSFMKENEQLIDPYGEDGEGWSVGGVAGNSLGFMLVTGSKEFHGPWTIWFNTCDFVDSSIIDDELKEVVWSGVSNCSKCNLNWENCGGIDSAVLGKEFGRLCHSPLMFINPDSKTLESVKKIMLLLKM